MNSIESEGQSSLSVMQKVIAIVQSTRSPLEAEPVWSAQPLLCENVRSMQIAFVFEYLHLKASNRTRYTSKAQYLVPSIPVAHLEHLC